MKINQCDIIYKKKPLKTVKFCIQHLFHSQPALVYYEYAITKRSDIYTKTVSCEKRVHPQNTRVKKDVKSKVAAEKWL